VQVIPSCVEPSHYPQADHLAADGSVRLVWIGSSSTLRGLERVAGIFDDIGAQVPSARLKLISDRGTTLGRLPVDLCRWSAATEATDLASADIGIAWMPDDDWSRGKCGLKVIQYMAAGLPVIANPVGVHTHLIRHGESGVLASTPAEWTAAVRSLAADPTLRQRMGHEGRNRVERELSTAVGGRLWREVLGSLAIQRRAAG
jgi:glycosyltransferase involved in cell wall biosynthesis